MLWERIKIRATSIEEKRNTPIYGTNIGLKFYHYLFHKKKFKGGFEDTMSNSLGGESNFRVPDRCSLAKLASE